MIDMTNWEFSVGGGRADLVALGIVSPPTLFSFPTVLDLLSYLGAGNELPSG